MEDTKERIRVFNIKSTEMLENSKGMAVTKKENRESNVEILKKIKSDISEVTKLFDTTIDVKEKGLLKRILQRFGSAERFIEGSINSYDVLVADKETAEKELEKKRKANREMITSRMEALKKDKEERTVETAKRRGRPPKDK